VDANLDRHRAVTEPTPRPSPWTPLRYRTFRALWLAQLGSNLGSWMQTVAAQWLLVGHHASLVALVQTASLLPVFFLSLPAGVFADTLDRRRLIYATTLAMALFAAVLAVVTAVGTTGPALLLGITFLIGCGTALSGPAWQAIQPDLVPREQIPNAAALGSVTVNAARAVGPALAGFLVAWVGPAPVFAINAISFVFIIVVVISWHPSLRPTQQDPERMGEALAAGTRYVRSAPGIRRIILRSVLFAAPASALWAILPIVSHQRYHLGASGYGLLLGALGVGALIGVWFLGRFRTRWSPNVILAASAATFGLATLSAAIMPLAITICFLVAGGAAWIGTLSTLNAAMQLGLPAWARARGLAAYILAFMGSQAVASFAWGLLADHTTVSTALVVSAAALALTALSVRALPMHDKTLQLDRTVSTAWPTPFLLLEPTPTDGPVQVDITYTVDAEQVPPFLAAMTAVERSRRRTGAQRWRLYRDGADPSKFRETFTVASWGEHLRQHGDRLTGTDRDILAAARQLATTEPVVEHLFPARTPAQHPPIEPGQGAEVGD
jgi:MFS family permease